MTFHVRMLQTALVVCMCAVVLTKALRLSSKERTTSIVELSSDEVLANLADWQSDLAFMTYRPNCEYCQSLEPYMESIAGLLIENSNLQVGRFNCERSKSHESVCSTLKLAYYPSIYFIGYGDMNQGGTSGHLLGRPKFVNERVVRYTASMLPEAIYDWIRMLSSISSWQRRWNNFKGIFTGKSGVSNGISRLQQQIAALKSQNAQLAEELETVKADQIFGNLTDHGDVYPLLHSLQPDKNNLPLRVCVVDMVSEYCRYHPEESYCKSFDTCERQQLQPVICRPEECPFKNKKGCVVVSTCMLPNVIMEYKKALKEGASS